MTAENALEVQGTLRAYPLAELIVEIAQSGLSGSLRLTHGDKKAVLYFTGGNVTYGVSNTRENRLFTHLIEKHRVAKDAIVKYPHFAKDLELAASLVADGVMTKEAMDAAIVGQIEGIMIDALTWTDGEWLFSPMARLRAEIAYDVRLRSVLMNYARCLPMSLTAMRFRSIEESFLRSEAETLEGDLLPHESAILVHFREDPLKIDQLRQMASMPDQGFLQALYVLWMGGALLRQNWNAAFTKSKVSAILSANLHLVKKAEGMTLPGAPKPKAEPEATETDETADAPKEETVQIEITLAEYLERVENAETHYDLLAVPTTADNVKIKAAYFGLAKLFHPDRYHRESEATLKRIQTAFTTLAHAYETLKKKDSREAYDFKIRKELEDRERRRKAGVTEEAAEGDAKAQSGLESFEQGLAALADEEFEAAATLLARAVHYSPENALFHAYYGKALSEHDNMRHKAEQEMQTAVKLDPTNTKIRMMLVNFFIDHNLAKRAEGELKRFLEVKPGDTEAMRALSRLQVK